MKRNKSLKIQLILYFVVLLVVTLSLISFIYYRINRAQIKENTGKLYGQNARMALSLIENNTEQAYNLLDYIVLNSRVEELLQRRGMQAAKFDQKNLEAINDISNLGQYFSAADAISGLFIIGNNGLDLRGGIDASRYPIERIQKLVLSHQSALDENIWLWGTREEKYFKKQDSQTFIPIIRTLNSVSTGQNYGQCVIAFEEFYFSDNYEELLEGCYTYLVDEAGEVVSSNTASRNVSDQTFFQKSTADRLTHFEITIDGTDYMVVNAYSPKLKWYLITLVPIGDMLHEIETFRSTIFLIFIAVCVSGLFAAMFLSTKLTKPLQLLVNQVHEISQGNFNTRIITPSGQELAQLGESIDAMQKDIVSLMDDAITKERDKRVLELRMLQSQITPHFLYNTLNSIKMMAVIQSARGIEMMTVALGNLLRSSLSGVEETVPLNRELEILEDYINIMTIQKKGKIRFEKQVDGNAESCMVLKFMLQPIVENSIIHGFGTRKDPDSHQGIVKKEAGTIRLSAWTENETLLIELYDDGMGIPEEKFCEVSLNAGSIAEGSDHIGLKNIIRRINLVYGEMYGLTIQSEEGIYTKITICLPMVTEGDDSHENFDR